ncbi:conserved hypothetical protein [Gammaproteobacteria bacterium]
MSYAITFGHFQYDKEVIRMSNEKNFDTLKYANRLKAVGVPEKQAEVQAETMAEIIEDKLATKKDLELVREDLELVKSELKRDIEATKSELKRDIKELELNMDLRIESSKNTTIVWLGSMIAVGVTILGFLIKFH